MATKNLSGLTYDGCVALRVDSIEYLTVEYGDEDNIVSKYIWSKAQA